MNYKRIMIALEDQHDLPILKHAMELAEKTGGNVTLLHINSSRAGSPSRVMRTLEHPYSEEELHALINNIPHKVPVDIKIIKSDHTTSTIIDISKDFDLLVMGHRRAHHQPCGL